MMTIYISVDVSFHASTLPRMFSMFTMDLTPTTVLSVQIVETGLLAVVLRDQQCQIMAGWCLALTPVHEWDWLIQNSRVRSLSNK